SRRRHTSWPRDWSSDVCSSDLELTEIPNVGRVLNRSAAEGGPSRASDGLSTRPTSHLEQRAHRILVVDTLDGLGQEAADRERLRSEERRVGKECRYGVPTSDEK